MSSSDYAGFWLRLVAFVIDAIVLSVVQLLLVIPLFDFFKTSRHRYWRDTTNDDNTVLDWISCYVSMINASHVILVVLAVLYFSFMESSRYQGTLGKLAMELKVISYHNTRPGFSTALWRNLAKLLSTLLVFAGFIMAAFTVRKQALHDKLAGTLVVKK